MAKNEKKDLKKLIDSFVEKYSKDSPVVSPILVHASLSSVGVGKNSPHFKEFGMEASRYNYVITLFRNEDDHYEINILIKMDGSEEDPVFEQYRFDDSQKAKVVEHFTMPSRLFNIKSAHKMAVSFEDVKMTRGEFNHFVELWTQSFQT